MDSVIVATAKYLVFVIGLVAAVYWFLLPKKQRIQMIVFGVIAAGLTLVLVKLGGAVFYDTRPFVAQHLTPLFPHAADNGFPSDHTALSAAIGVTMYALSKRLGLVLLGLAVLVGVSRVLAHVHSPIDILGSFVFAAVGGLIAYYLTPKIMARVLK